MNHLLLAFVATVSAVVASQVGVAKVGGKVAPDGKTELQCDLPASLYLKNVGGSDGKGLCVFTSIGHSSRFQNVELLSSFRDYMRKYPGGGWPQKVDQYIEKISKESGVPKPDYIQVQGGRETIDILKAALQSGRMPSVTYSKSPTGRYNGQRIAHMVNLVHLDSNYVAVLDNNYIEPQDKSFEWMSVDQFLASYTGGKSGWAVILLDPGPPPFPFTKGA